MQVEQSDKETPNASVEDLNTAAKKDQDSVNSLYLKMVIKSITITILIHIELIQTFLKLSFLITRF
jgi:hypothetical protein